MTITTATARLTRIRPFGGRITAAFGVVLALATMSAIPAFSEDYHHGSAPQQNGRGHEGPHDNYHQDNHRTQHNTYYRNGGNDYHGVYRDPYVYAPPPVTYVPEATPGISLFFPLQFR
ncbi:hypothetical protein [Cupriavidus pauculus]|uniref:Uncharacterized protein n=1 Tax=Cupriavidus pauculus TaxID=82633 RepID=A0A2N5C703_9BURK|nr:hypothetical protein [Cupriavidus pauculus]PLP97967.1 hypothetical protein CYJ10_24615 [Cupriavidus pauculus]